MAAPKVIAVMGVTGVGKSSFVKLVTGDDTISVGDSLVSETAEVKTYKFRHKDRTIILVDTPGFDDTHRKDADVLKQLAHWFDETYKSGTKLSGIIYLHRITDDRMRGSSLRSMRMFRQLCGESFYKNLLLGTTCWSLISEEVGSSREKELMTDDNFWKGLVGKGAQFVRMPDDGWEAKELVYDLARLEPVSLQIQKEMTDSNLKFGALSATQTIEEDMSNLQVEHEDKKRQLEAEHHRQIIEQQQREQRLQIEMARERQKALLMARLKAEHEAMTESTTKYTEGVKENKFFAKLFPLAIAFSTTCDGCCKWVGNENYYVCTKCNDGKFVLCGKCYNGTLTCFDESHHNSMQMLMANDGPPQCRHITYPPPPESLFACYRCANQLSGIFVHCCACLNDSFNMCLECLTNMGTCKKSWSLSGHRLHPILRRPRHQLASVVPDSDPVVPVSNPVVPVFDPSQSLFDLAGKHKEDEKWTEAESVYLQVVSMREKEHGIDDQLLRDSYYNLGLVYQSLGKYDDAASKLKLALDGEDKTYGTGDNRAMFTAYKLGQVYKNQGKSDAATCMFLRAIGRETSFGAGDIAVRNARFELGLIYDNSGQTEEAVSFYEMTVRGEEEALGVDNTDTLITVNRLANMYRRLNRYDDAERSYLRVLSARQQSLEPNHKNLLDTYYNLGLVYRDCKKYVAAGVNFNKAITGYETTLGANDSETLDAIDEAAAVLVLDCKYRRAADLYRTVIQRRRESLGSKHADTKVSEQKLAEVEQKLQAAKPATFHRTSTAGSWGSRDFMQLNSALESPVAQLVVAALPPVPTLQPLGIWSPHELQMVLAQQLDPETRDGQGRTALLYAIQQNDYSAVQQLLGMGADVSSSDTEGRTSLHFAFQTGYTQLANLCLDRGISAMVRDAQGSIPLHYAAVAGNDELVATCLVYYGPAKHGFDIEVENQNGYTALQLAAINGRRSTLELLMAYGAQGTKWNGRRGMTAAHMAAKKGHTEILQSLHHAGHPVDYLSAAGMNPLHVAAEHGHASAAAALLQLGAQVDARCPSTGWTPLFYSTIHGHDAVSQVLIAAGADTRITEATGYPLLHTLAFNDRASGLRVLFEHGVDIEGEDHFGNTALMHAIRPKTHEVLQLLLELGANIGARDKQNGGTALHYAVANGQDIAAQVLVSFGADVNAVDSYGQTPLHVAVLNRNEEGVRLLTGSGANVGATNKDGQNALQLAALNNQTAIMTMLVLSSQQ